MRIGVSVPDPSGPDPQGRPPLDQVRDTLRRAADEGFPSAWMNNIFGLDALTALAVAGSQVPGIELGTAVVPTYPRHPAALAQQALTVAAATDGRLTLGVGTSHEIVIRDMFGYDFSKPVEHTREFLSILRPLLHGEAAKVHGNQLSADITLAIPAPTPVPLLLAALGPRMLRLAAQYADGTVLWMTGPATVRSHIVPTITAAAQAAGRPIDPEQDAAMRKTVEDQIESESLATFTSGQVFDDGIIDPRDTRTVLGIALSAALSAEVKGSETFGVFRM